MLTTSESVFLDHLLDRLLAMNTRLDSLLERQAEVLHRLDLLESCEGPEQTDMEARRGY